MPRAWRNGRRNGLKIRFPLEVWVRFPPPAPFWNIQCPAVRLPCFLSQISQQQLLLRFSEDRSTAAGLLVAVPCQRRARDQDARTRTVLRDACASMPHWLDRATSQLRQRLTEQRSSRLPRTHASPLDELDHAKKTRTGKLGCLFYTITGVKDRKAFCLLRRSGGAAEDSRTVPQRDSRARGKEALEVALDRRSNLADPDGQPPPAGGQSLEAAGTSGLIPQEMSVH